MSAFAVIVAAGQGSRLPGAVPKQYLELNGEALYVRALRAAEAARGIAGSVLVVPEADVARVRTELAACVPALSKLRDVVAGGVRRQDSVRAGAVRARAECEIVAVHDAARPFASPELFDAVCEAAGRTGAAIPAVPVADTVKETAPGGLIGRTVDRSRLLFAQTPQAFRVARLIESLDWAEETGATVTDEASLFEQRGLPVEAVAGDPRNIKITRPEDLDLARALCGPGGETRGERIGLGEDIHPLVPGLALVLGGVVIPHETGLQGHSDADALTHALVDALCGAAGLPSIGELFPDTDPKWRGASSLVLLGDVSARAAQAGWRLVNADIVVLCQSPKLQPHVEKMKQTLAASLAALGGEPGRIGIRGKSPEGLGPEGRGEAISARAIVLLHRGRT